MRDFQVGSSYHVLLDDKPRSLVILDIKPDEILGEEYTKYTVQWVNGDQDWLYHADLKKIIRDRLEWDEKEKCESCSTTENVIEWAIHGLKDKPASHDDYEYKGDAMLCHNCYYNYYATPDEISEEREMQRLRESDPANW